MNKLRTILRNVLIWVGVTFAGYVVILTTSALFEASFEQMLSDGFIVVWAYVSMFMISPFCTKE